MVENAAEIAINVRDMIYRATIMLDDQRWTEWLDLCGEDFHYAIKSFSPEINMDMTYLQGGRSDLATLIRLLPKHNTDHSPLNRHTSVYTVNVAEDGQTAEAVSSFVVYQNLLDGVNSHIDSGEKPGSFCPVNITTRSRSLAQHPNLNRAKCVSRNAVSTKDPTGRFSQ